MLQLMFSAIKQLPTLKNGSVLKKHDNSFAYHCKGEVAASKTIRVAHESGSTSLADVLTKLMLRAT